MWRCRGSNPGPFTCKANALPLSYIPVRSFAFGYFTTLSDIHSYTISPATEEMFSILSRSYLPSPQYYSVLGFVPPTGFQYQDADFILISDPKTKC